MNTLTKAALMMAVLLIGIAGSVEGGVERAPSVDSPFGAHGGQENNGVTTEELFAELEAIGVRYKRLAGPESLGWGMIEKNLDGNYRWNKMDDLLELATEHGINLVVTIKSGNTKDRESCGSANPCDQDKYEAFLGEAIRRYGSQIKYWQPENEVSGIFYDGSPTEYADLLSTSYRVIKENCSDCEVLIAGMPDIHRDSEDYYGQVLDSLTCDCFDILDLHTPFSGGHEVLEKKYEDTQIFLEEHGFAGKPIWSTEFSSLKADADTIADELPKMFAIALSAGFEKLFWRVSECPSCILDGPGSPTSTYDAYRDLIWQVEGYSTVTKISDTHVQFGFPDGSSTLISLDGSSEPQTRITVTSPNGGESWTPTSSHAITWSASNVQGSVRIALNKGGVYLKDLTASTSAGAGSWTWQTLENEVPGSDYWISIASVSDPSISDESDGDFEISDAPDPSDGIVLTSPVGGESWDRGTTQEITWTSSGVTGQARIYLLRSGRTVGLVSGGTPLEAGSYTWNIRNRGPNVHDLTIRVVSQVDPDASDESDGEFSVTR